jgi:uncharacterized phage-associated protein
MTYKAIDVANWFIAKTAEFGDLTTHLKIQKLLYYAEAWTQVLLDKELFEEQIQAWSHGPVVPEVFQEFKSFGWNPLPIPSENAIPTFSKDITDVLEQVFEVYGDISAKKLEDMTHTDKPWIEARGDCEPEIRCTNIMPKAKIKQYFLAKYAEDLSEKTDSSPAKASSPANK